MAKWQHVTVKLFFFKIKNIRIYLLTQAPKQWNVTKTEVVGGKKCVDGNSELTVTLPGASLGL